MQAFAPGLFSVDGAGVLDGGTGVDRLALGDTFATVIARDSAEAGGESGGAECRREK
jgi:hypothetical protein